MSYFLQFRAVRSLPCSVKVLIGMEPHAKTPPPPVLSPPEVTATQANPLICRNRKPLQCYMLCSRLCLLKTELLVANQLGSRE